MDFRSQEDFEAIVRVNNGYPMDFRGTEKCSENAWIGPPIRLESQKGKVLWAHKPHFRFSVVNCAFFGGKKVENLKNLHFYGFWLLGGF